MNTLLAMGGAATTIAGLMLILAWLANALPTESASSSTSLWIKLRRRFAESRPHLLRWVLVLAAALVATWYTGWPILLLAVPAATIIMPRLLSDPPQRDIELLQALDRWVRVMTATMASGKSIIDSLRTATRQTSPPLRDPLVLLVRRLDDRWTPDAALRALADELDSPDADAVIASLILAVNRGGNGATATLTALADSIQDRLRALREIETERAKPRLVVRQVTFVTVAVVVLALLFGGSFLQPYATPLGQGILTLLIAAYVASLVFLRRMTLPRQRERILRGAS